MIPLIRCYVKLRHLHCIIAISMSTPLADCKMHFTIIPIITYWILSQAGNCPTVTCNDSKLFRKSQKQIRLHLILHNDILKLIRSSLVWKNMSIKTFYIKNRCIKSQFCYVDDILCSLEEVKWSGMYVLCV